MGAYCRRMLAVIVVLCIRLFELELALTVLAGLVPVSFTRCPVLLEVHQFPQRALGLGAAGLGVLHDRLLDVVAHDEQLLARGDVGAIAAILEHLFDRRLRLAQIGAQAVAKIRRRRRRFHRSAHIGQRRRVAAAWRLRGLGARLRRLSLATQAGGRHAGWAVWATMECWGMRGKTRPRCTQTSGDSDARDGRRQAAGGRQCDGARSMPGVGCSVLQDTITAKAVQWICIHTGAMVSSHGRRGECALTAGGIAYSKLTQ